MFASGASTQARDACVPYTLLRTVSVISFLRHSPIQPVEPIDPLPMALPSSPPNVCIIYGDAGTYGGPLLWAPCAWHWICPDDLIAFFEQSSKDESLFPPNGISDLQMMLVLESSLRILFRSLGPSSGLGIGSDRISGVA
ncbi:hypothetical protein T440DRAFT_76410 [Plenodomus tracheiphilus IPT5]|uniref:Uncharacterized protein n=1 Tax=Plenodomus tracheiphilus IPT5 TaxID=1408161 RepID=A0A6A7B9V6_9PLEO|nr:hypothetical protein T440DRAFT_76410 [Plenodomus tracheiphilus IPT5]